MKLAQLLEPLSSAELHGDGAVEIAALACDSRQVQPGTLFFALTGTTTDGHRFIEQALAAGAAAVVLEDAGHAPAGVPWVKVADGRAAMARMAAAF
ncbi:MAG TPA: Mur ligase domain-containing protein, partial [Desulfuromonadaceae bacterium]